MNNDAISKANVILKIRSLFFFAMMMTAHSACAQNVENSRFKDSPGMVPVMKITNLQKDETDPMKIDELKIDIRVLGQNAVTTMEFSYFNMNDRVMEGEFNFPLAEGQIVSRFALDINGKMREGVVIEKEEGRKTFETIARRKVDPGLLERTAGNNFRARVYPLPARGYRRIIIAYEQELADKGQGYLYQLPLKLTDEIREFSIHAEVIKQQVKLDTEKNELSNFEFKQWNDSYLADFKKENYLPDKQLAFMIPYTPGDVTSYTESISERSDSSWFYFSLRPKQFNRGKKIPQKITLLWDNSNSCDTRDIEKELLVLDDYIQKIGNLQVELVPFNVRVEKSSVFNITGGNWSDLKKLLLHMTYDGGTSFGIDFSKYNSDEILLFSDGLSDFGSSNPTFSSVPVIGINSNIVANHSFLTYISQNTGGRYINLTKLTAKEALSMLITSDYHFISAKITEGSISEVYPSRFAPFQSSFSQSGILKGKSATILLNFGFGNEVVYTEKVVISNERSSNTGILRRTWAQKKLQNLMINEEANKDIISLLGKEYSIVTPNTSLIVLDNLEDYLQYHIVPPKEMQADYFNRVKHKDQGANDQIKNHLDVVATMFEARVKWWNTVYPAKEVVQKPIKNVLFSAPMVVDQISEVNAISQGVVGQINEEPVFMVVEESAQFPASTQSSTYKKDSHQNDASIQLNAWDPQTPYLKVLEYTDKGQEYGTYLKLKKEYGMTPGFYADAFDFFIRTGKRDTAVKIISNLAELELDNPQLLRILGQKLLQAKYTSWSVEVFKKVLKLRGEDPQSYRDLGLAYEADGQYQLAISTLYEVVKREWNERFSGIELIALEEINNIIANHKIKPDYSFIDKRLTKNLPVDIRVVLTWDTDNCDMDLWVTDSSGEKCAYDHTETRIGGIISHDFTQGYGPEVFLLKKAANGKYLVQANYYGTNSQNLLAPVTLHLTFFTNYGKPNQQKQEATIRLENKQDVIDVGKFMFGL